MTTMEGVLPAPLLRSLQSFAAPDEDADQTETSFHSSPTRGAIIGTRRPLEASGSGSSVKVAVFGLLRLSSEAAAGQSFDRYLPGGVSRIGSFIVVRGEASETENDLGTWQFKVAKVTKVANVSRPMH
jgi:hypothetical protein